MTSISSTTRSRERHEQPESAGIRDDMIVVGSRLPDPISRLVQAFLTWLTGKPFRGQEPLFTLTPSSHLILTLSTLFIGAFLGVFAIANPPLGWLLLPISFLLIVSSERKIFLTLNHAAIHGVFFRSPYLNRLLCNALSLLIFTQPYKQFRLEHVIKHHGKSFCTENDPDMQILNAFGIRPGYSRHRLWRNLVSALFSPRFHGIYIWARLKANLFSAGPLRSIVFCGFWALTLIAIHSAGAWTTFLIVWVVPTIFGFQMVALVAFSGEHRWFRKKKESEDRRQWVLEQTHARFVGSSPPARSFDSVHGLFQWIAWCGQMLFWHLPLRLLIVPGDMPAHDYHHVHARGDWCNALYARQRDIENGARYSESWGIFETIDTFFTELSATDRVRFGRSLRASDFLAM